MNIKSFSGSNILNINGHDCNVNAASTKRGEKWSYPRLAISLANINSIFGASKAAEIVDDAMDQFCQYHWKQADGNIAEFEKSINDWLMDISAPRGREKGSAGFMRDSQEFRKQALAAKAAGKMDEFKRLTTTNQLKFNFPLPAKLVYIIID